MSRSSRGRALVLVIASGLMASAAAATPQGDPAGPGIAGNEPEGATGVGGSIGTTAHELRDRALPLLGGVEAGSDVAIALVSDLPPQAPRAAAMLDALSVALRTALRADGRFAAVDRIPDGYAAEGLPARAARSGYHHLVVVTVGIVGRSLVMNGEVVRAGGGGFRDVLSPAPARLGAFDLRVPLDAHLRHYVGNLPLVTDQSVLARTVTLPSRGYVAMAASDLDHDGRTELFLATPTRVDVVRLGPGRRAGLRAVRVASMPLSPIAPPAARARRSVGTSVAVDGRVLFRLSDHTGTLDVHLRQGRLAWSATEEPPCPDDGYPLPDGCASRVTGRDYFHAELLPLGEHPAPPPAPSGFYARRTTQLRQPDGSDLFFEAVVTPRGRIGARAGQERGGAVGYGAALGMADLEGDGMPELLVSADTPTGGPDRLSLLRIRSDGSVIAVWSSEETEGPVLLAGSGDLDGDGGSELLAIEEPPSGVARPARLWMVR